MPEFTATEIMAIVEFHMSDNETKADEWDRAVDEYNANVRAGLADDVPDDEAVVRNLAYETGDALSSTLTPRKPQLKIGAKQAHLRDAAEAQEGLVKEAFRQGNLESQIRKGITLASLQDYSVLKTVWKDRKKRPAYRALPAKNFFFDPNAESWDEVGYVGEITVLTMPKIKARAKRKRMKKGEKAPPRYKQSVVEQMKSETLPSWLTPNGLGELGETSRSAMKDMLGQRVVVELIVFDDTGGPPQLIHIAPGIEQALLDIPFPHRFMQNPYSLLVLEVALQGLTNSSPYKLIKAAGKHLNQLESIRAGVAKASIPIPILNLAMVKDPDKFMTAFASATDPADAIEIELVAPVPLSDVIMFSQVPGTTSDLDQTIKAVESRIDSTLGIPSYLRAGNSGADFAAEIQLQSLDRSTRAGTRRKVIDDLVIDIGVKSLQLYADMLDHDDVVYVRAAEGELPQTVNRELAALAIFGKRAGEVPLEMDYNVRVVDEASENSVVRLQAMQPFLPVLLQLAQAGAVEATPIVVQLLRWLGLEIAIPDDPNTVQEQIEASAQAAEAPVPGVSGGQSGVSSGASQVSPEAAAAAQQTS